MVKKARYQDYDGVNAADVLLYFIISPKVIELTAKSLLSKFWGA